jgi:hypothetical protein
VTPAARRRPGLVALAYGYRALAGLLVALPAAAALGGATSGYPRGHAELFDPGAVMLVEALRLARRAIPAVVASATPIAVLAVLGAIFPLGVLLVGLSTEGRVSAGFLAARTFRHAGTLALLFGLCSVAQASACGLTLVIGGKLVGALSLSAPAEDRAFAVELAVGLALVATLGVARDLASAATVAGDHGLHAAATIGLSTLRRAGARALFAWGWRASLGGVGIVSAALLAPAAAGATPAGTALAALIHQAALAGATFAHASWLAAALRLVQPAQASPERPDEAADGEALRAAPEPEAESEDR